MSKEINTNKGQQGNLTINTTQDLIFNHFQTFTQKRADS